MRSVEFLQPIEIISLKQLTMCNEFNVFHVRALYYTKILITNKMHRESFIISRNTLLHVSTLLGHLQGPQRVHATSTQSTAHSHSTVKCNPSVTVTKKFSLKMTQQGRNMEECVTIDDKTLFVHLLVISVFVY
jgi:hypothetical protein